MIATQSEEGRVPLRTIQWYVQKLHGLKLSLGELVDILHLTAKRGQATVDKLKEEVRGSPVVYGDETGMRENGQNGYIWSFSTPNVRYFEYKHTPNKGLAGLLLIRAHERRHQQGRQPRDRTVSSNWCAGGSLIEHRVKGFSESRTSKLRYDYGRS